MQSLIQSFTGDKREKHRYAQFTSVLLFFPIDAKCICFAIISYE